MAAVFVGSCGDGTEGGSSPEADVRNAFPLTIESCGTEITLEQSPMRVLLIGPAALPLMAAVDAADRVIGSTGGFPLEVYDDLRAAAEAIPTVGVTSSGELWRSRWRRSSRRSRIW